MPALLSPLQALPKNPAITSQRIHLIADDLTGACDAAAPFLPSASVRVWLDTIGDPVSPETIQAFNTNSRNLTPSAAAAIVADCARHCPSNALAFKKIDSAGRGPIAAELLAAHAALRTRSILFAPSFPTHGRTVVHGILHVSHASGPETTLDLAALFPQDIHYSIAIIGKPRSLHLAFMSGKTIMICNAQTDSDLEALIDASSALPQPILYAGSAGLARALASHHRDSDARPARLPIAHETLLIVGTQHPVTQIQLGHLEQHQPTANILTIRCDTADAEIIRARFTRQNPDALLLTGGDTALLTLQSLGARSILLRGEIAPGIPWGIIDGGLADGRLLVTKSGGFGSAPTLKDILQTLAGTA